MTSTRPSRIQRALVGGDSARRSIGRFEITAIPIRDPNIGHAGQHGFEHCFAAVRYFHGAPDRN